MIFLETPVPSAGKTLLTIAVGERPADYGRGSRGSGTHKLPNSVRLKPAKREGLIGQRRTVGLRSDIVTRLSLVPGKGAQSIERSDPWENLFTPGSH